MAIELTTDEKIIVDEISKLCAELWARSEEISGLNTDPKMLSIMLFKRLWSHHRGFIVLWNAGLYLEADIILRAGLEAAICIAANFNLGTEFVGIVRQDAAFTVQSQIKLMREGGEEDAVREGEESLRMLQAGLPDGVKAAKLNWSYLADKGGVPQLYGFHKHLSGVSAHVTGLSLMRGVIAGERSAELNVELTALAKKMHVMMIAGATLHGALLHAGMIDDAASAKSADALITRMNDLSFAWPGVEPEAGRA